MKSTCWVMDSRLGGRCYPDIAAWKPRELRGNVIGFAVSLEFLLAREAEDLRDIGTQRIDEYFTNYAAPGEEGMERTGRAISEFWKTNPHRRIIVCCAGGNGRTGTVIAARMIWESNSQIPAEETIARLRSVRPRAPRTPAQEHFLHQ